jgi:MFS-type transporter involved in bile tolerance (Atg22 family)
MLLSARVAAVVGPLLWGLTTTALEGPIGTSLAYRAAVMVVAIMFVVSIWILRGVPDRHMQRLRAA